MQNIAKNACGKRCARAPQVRTRPSPVSIDNSTKLDATWSVGENFTEKPPNDWLPMLSRPAIKDSRVGLAPARLIIVGSPEYLKRNGMPKTPADLKRHNCLGYAYWSLRDEWHVTTPRGKLERVRVTGSLVANNGDALRVAALEGVGLIQQPSFSICDDLRSGRLVQVLPDHTIRELTVHALYAPGAAPNAKVRALIDMLAKAWAGSSPPTPPSPSRS